jgi:hypothetical protein
MNFNEAIDAIGTTSSDTEGVKKRLGMTRRKVPAGFIETEYAIDQYKDDKKKIKKKKKKRKDEGRRITRDDRPMYTGDWHRDFFKKGDNEKELEDDEDEKKLKELLMQVSGPEDRMYMDSFWSNGKKYDKNGDEIESDEDEEEPESDKNTDEEEAMQGMTKFVDPYFEKNAVDPFWRKGKDSKSKNSYIDYDEEEEEEEEEEENDWF